MTYREKLAKDKPTKVGRHFIGGCQGCPGDYYPRGLTETDDCYDREDWDCEKCWNQEMTREDEQGMKIYIAGPITGVDDYRARFAKAERELTELGHVVLNPAALPEGLGNHRVYMSLCLPMVDAAEAVLMLPGWEKSQGACMEWGYATGLGKIVVEYEDFFGKA